LTNWLRLERERTKITWQRVSLVWKENRQFKTKTDVIEAGIELVEAVIEMEKQKELEKRTDILTQYQLEYEHHQLCQKRHMLKHFPDYYFSKEELAKLRERYPNIKRFRKEREKAKPLR
jgi:hypothetical protein